MNFGTVTIVGVGLIGGSVGLALRSRGLADCVVGFGRDAARLEEARRLAAIDWAEADLGAALKGATVAVVCTPVSRIAEAVRQCARLGNADLLITDVGSTKHEIVSAAEAEPESRRRFVGAHPIAGSEQSGAENARADLFQAAICALTPTAQTPPDRVQRAKDFWQSLGCRVCVMSAADHDRALALVSHLPHVVAGALSRCIDLDLHLLAGGAFRDSTRVAASDTDLWTAVFLQNRKQLLTAIERFRGQLDSFADALERGGSESLREWWNQARARRIAFQNQQSADAELELP